MPVVGSADAVVIITRTGGVTIKARNQGYVGTSLNGGSMNITTSRNRRLGAGLGMPNTAADPLAGTLFTTQNLGWLNFDHPLPDKPAVLFTVLAGDANVRANVVRRNTRTVLGGLASSEDRHLFPGAPDGEAATIVALKQENGQTYLAMQPATLGNRTEGSLAFRPVTLAELRTALAQLEQ